MRTFKWWYFGVLRLVKLAFTVPLATGGFVALLMLFHDWRFWLLIIFFPLYVGAEVLLNVEDVMTYWRQRKEQNAR